MIRAGVIGSPAKHSLSPIIHKAWLKEAGVEGDYRAYDIAIDQFEDTVAALRAEGLSGLNVTVPFKERALALADTASEDARQAGAANVLVFQDGIVHAENTDGIGVLMALRPVIGDIRETRTYVILGAGGAAGGALMALHHSTSQNMLGEAQFRLVNRTRDKASRLAARFEDRVFVYDWSEMATALARADVIINATSMGLNGLNSLVVPFEVVGKPAVVMDMVYNPLDTVFLQKALEAGHRTLDGLDMLIGQAEPSFYFFYGTAPSRRVDVRTLCLDELERRRR
jgi:shikimate dehydrogenase